MTSLPLQDFVTFELCPFYDEPGVIVAQIGRIFNKRRLDYLVSNIEVADESLHEGFSQP